MSQSFFKIEKNKYRFGLWFSRSSVCLEWRLLIVGLFHIKSIFFTGNYSVLGVTFVFTRRLGHYLTRVYIPAIFIVLMSWLSFFVDRTSAPARVSLGITTVLTMTTLLIGIGQGSLPVVSYVKAVDWYLIVCYTLVIGAFAEYVLVSYLEIMSHQQTEGYSHEAVRFYICRCLFHTYVVCGVLLWHNIWNDLFSC